MSQRDRELLDEAGLNITDAARLFGRSRQAFYTGLSNDRDYFSPQDVIEILNSAKRRGFARLGELIQFIEAAYPDYTDLALPERLGVESVIHALNQSQKILLTTNGNPEHLVAGGAFAKVLNAAMKRSSESVRLILPAEWVVGYVEQENSTETNQEKVLFPPAEQICYRDEVAFLPSFVMTEDAAKRYRAFVFGRFTIEEMLAAEARKLWNYLAPTSAWQIGMTLIDVAG